MINKIYQILFLSLIALSSCTIDDSYQSFRLPLDQEHDFSTDNIFISNQNLFIPAKTTSNGSNIILNFQEQGKQISKRILPSAESIITMTDQYLVAEKDVLTKNESITLINKNTGKEASLFNGHVTGIDQNILLLWENNNYKLVIDKNIIQLKTSKNSSLGQLISVDTISGALSMIFLQNYDSVTYFNQYLVDNKNQTLKLTSVEKFNTSIVAAKSSKHDSSIYVLSTSNEVYKILKKYPVQIQHLHDGLKGESFLQIEVIDNNLVILFSREESKRLEIIDLNSGNTIFSDEVISAYFNSQNEILLGRSKPNHTIITYLTEDHNIIEINSSGQIMNKFKLNSNFSNLYAASISHILLFSKQNGYYYLIPKEQLDRR